MPGLYRKRIDLDAYELPAEAPAQDMDYLSSLSEASDSDDKEVEVDSVILTMKDRRKASGQEIADIKLRSKLHGSAAAALRERKAQQAKSFLDQFPYKSCQRGSKTGRKRLEKRKSLEASPEKANLDMEIESTFELSDILEPPNPEAIKHRRSALVPSKKSQDEVRYVASKAAMAALAASRLKTFVHPTTRYIIYRVYNKLP